jgi:hypothetical protein
VSVAGHEIPADDFIAPKRSRMHEQAHAAIVAESERPEDDGIRAC